MVRLIKVVITCSVLLLPGMLFAAACNVNTSAINFGGYNVFSPTPMDTTGQVTVSCAGNSGVNSVIVALENSNNSGSINNRTLGQLNGNDKLNYNLYTDASRTTIWGNGVGNSITQTVAIRGASPTILTVYGRIPALQDANIGLYSDSVTVTITF